MKHDTTPSHIIPPDVTPPRVAAGCAGLARLLLMATGWSPRITGAGLMATAITAGCMHVRPDVMLYRPGDGVWRTGGQHLTGRHLVLRALWLMTTSTILPGMAILMAAMGLPDTARSDEPANEPATEAVVSPSAPPPVEAPVGAATRNLEKYRTEIEALVRGAPSFTDSRNRLALPRSLPGDPLTGMTPPAGEAGGMPAARQNTSTLMVFLTLSMPDGALAGWLDQTARAGGVAVIRGFHGDRLSTTLKRLVALQEAAPATKTHGGVSIDPTAFARFGVEVAPTVIVSAAPLPPCATKGCAGDPAPAHDRIAGNVTLDYALRLLAADGDQATGVARHHLARLEATGPEDGGGGP